MSAEVTASIGIQCVITGVATEGSGTTTDRFGGTDRFRFTAGTGALKLSVQWHDLRTLGGSADALDLAGGVATFAKVKVLDIKATDANAGDITVGGGSNAFAALLSGTLTLPPGARAVIVAPSANGWAVAAGTGDILRVSGTSGDAYEIAVAGE